MFREWLSYSYSLTVLKIMHVDLYRLHFIYVVGLYLYVTQSRETVPNRTSGKIKLTPPAYSHTTALLVSNLNFSLPNRG